MATATFKTFTAAVSYAAGFCVSRVVVAMRWKRIRSSVGVLYDARLYVVCHPRTARRNGWRVMSS